MDLMTLLMRSDKAALSLPAYEILEPPSGRGLGGDEDGLQLKPLGAGAGRAEIVSSFAAVPPDSIPGKPSVSITRGRAGGPRESRCRHVSLGKAGLTLAKLKRWLRKEARDVVYVFYLSDKDINSASHGLCACVSSAGPLPPSLLLLFQRGSASLRPQLLRSFLPCAICIYPH